MTSCKEERTGAFNPSASGRNEGKGNIKRRSWCCLRHGNPTFARFGHPVKSQIHKQKDGLRTQPCLVAVSWCVYEHIFVGLSCPLLDAVLYVHTLLSLSLFQMQLLFYDEDDQITHRHGSGTCSSLWNHKPRSIKQQQVRNGKQKREQAFKSESCRLACLLSSFLLAFPSQDEIGCGIYSFSLSWEIKAESSSP